MEPFLFLLRNVPYFLPPNSNFTSLVNSVLGTLNFAHMGMFPFFCSPLLFALYLPSLFPQFLISVAFFLLGAWSEINHYIKKSMLLIYDDLECGVTLIPIITAKPISYISFLIKYTFSCSRIQDKPEMDFVCFAIGITVIWFFLKSLITFKIK